MDLSKLAETLLANVFPNIVTIGTLAILKK